MLTSFPFICTTQAAMDIDKMFKLPPSGSGLGAKRKLPDLPSDEVLKRFRQDDSANESDSRVVTVEDPTTADEGAQSTTHS